MNQLNRTETKSAADLFEEIGEQELMMENRSKKKSKSSKIHKSKKMKQEDIEYIMFDDSKDATSDFFYDLQDQSRNEFKNSKIITQVQSDLKENDPVKKVIEDLSEYNSYTETDKKLDNKLNVNLNDKKLDGERLNDNKLDDKLKSKDKSNLRNDDQMLEKDKEQLNEKLIKKDKEQSNEKLIKKDKEQLNEKLIKKDKEQLNEKLIKKDKSMNENKSTDKTTGQTTPKNKNSINEEDKLTKNSIDEFENLNTSRAKRESARSKIVPIEAPVSKKRKCTLANDPLRFVKPVDIEKTPPIGLRLGLSRRSSSSTNFGFNSPIVKNSSTLQSNSSIKIQSTGLRHPGLSRNIKREKSLHPELFKDRSS